MHTIELKKKYKISYTTEAIVKRKNNFIKRLITKEKYSYKLLFNNFEDKSILYEHEMNQNNISNILDLYEEKNFFCFFKSVYFNEIVYYRTFINSYEQVPCSITELLENYNDFELKCILNQLNFNVKFK